jgi:hypothetical protein
MENELQNKVFHDEAKASKWLESPCEHGRKLFLDPQAARRHERIPRLSD